jgi:hypothetical protein
VLEWDDWEGVSLCELVWEYKSVKECERVWEKVLTKLR